MEVQINEKIVTEKTLMQLKTLNSLGSSGSRNQKNISPRKTFETRQGFNNYESKPNKKIENELQKINKIIQSNSKFSSVRKQLNKKEAVITRALQTQQIGGKQVTSAKIDITLDHVHHLMRSSAVTKQSGEVTTLAGASNTFMELTSPFE